MIKELLSGLKSRLVIYMLCLCMTGGVYIVTSVQLFNSIMIYIECRVMFKAEAMSVAIM